MAIRVASATEAFLFFSLFYGPESWMSNFDGAFGLVASNVGAAVGIVLSLQAQTRANMGSASATHLRFMGT
jgi:hypothetical protein